MPRPSDFGPMDGHEPYLYDPPGRRDPEYVERQEEALWKIRSAFPELKIPAYGYRYDDNDEPILLVILEALAVVAQAAQDARDYPPTCDCPYA